MLAMWVKVRVKPELRQRFLEAIEVDALGSERRSEERRVGKECRL